MDHDENKRTPEDIELDIPEEQPRDAFDAALLDDDDPAAKQTAQQTEAPPKYAPHTPDEPSKPGSSLGKLLKLAIPVIAVLLVIGLAVSMLGGGSPVEQIVKSVNNTMDAAASSEMLSVVGNVLKNGSVEAMLDLDEASDGEIEGAISGKVYFNSKDVKCAAMADFELDEETVAEVAAYISKDAIVVDSETVLEEALGIDLTKLADSLANSVFNPDFDTDFALDSDTFDALTELLDEDTTKEAEALRKDMEKLYNEFWKVLIESIETNAKIEEEADELTFEDTNVKVNTITVRVNDKAVASIAEDVLTWAYESKDLEDWLESMIDLYGFQLESVLDYYGIMLDDDTLDEFYYAMEDLLDRIDDIEDELDDFDLRLRFHISKRGKELVKLEYMQEQYGYETEISLIMGPSLKDPELISLQYDDGWDKFSITYTVAENTKEEYTAKVRIKEDSETTYSGSFTWNRKEGDFRLKLTDEWYGDELSIRGTLVRDGKVVTLDFDRIEENGGEPYGTASYLLRSLTLTFNESDAVPETPVFTDVLAISYEDEFYDLIDTIEDALYDFGETLSGVID